MVDLDAGREPANFQRLASRKKGGYWITPYKNVIIHQLFLQRYVHRNVGNIQDSYFQTPSSCDRCYTATSIHIWGICKVKLSSTDQWT